MSWKMDKLGGTVRGNQLPAVELAMTYIGYFSENWIRTVLPVSLCCVTYMKSFFVSSWCHLICDSVAFNSRNTVVVESLMHMGCLACM